MTHLENLVNIKQLCLKIVSDPKTADIAHLGNIIRDNKSWGLLQNLQRDLLATFYIILKHEAQNKSNLTVNDKLILIEILDKLLFQTKLDNQIVFFNLFGFLLQDIYDNETHKIKNISEEHKLAILSCVKSLLNSTTTDLTLILYTKENGKRLCKMIYVAVEIATHEKFRALRIEAIECLMALFKSYSESDYADPLFRRMVADSFSYFLPGVASCLRSVALGDDNVGYKLIKTSIKAMGRIISLLMQDYNEGNNNVSSLEQAKSIALYHLNEYNTSLSEKPITTEGRKDTLKQYMEGVRNKEWFKKSDEHMARLLFGYRKLTQHQIVEVRSELSEMCNLFIRNCSRFMPVSHRYLVEILIILSEDQDAIISQRSKSGLNKLTTLISNGQNAFLMNKMQSGFYETFSEMPNVFNGIDDRDKIAILNLTAGYINLFGPNLQLHDCFGQFMRILLHLCEFEVDMSTFDENIIQDLEDDHSLPLELWKNFKFLKDESVRKQFSHLVHSLVKNDLFETLADFLITVYQNEEEKKEATYLLNELIVGLKNCSYGNKRQLIQPIFNLYIDPNNWNLPLIVNFDDSDDRLTLRAVRSNIQQAALAVHGIGIMAEVLQDQFRPFLLHSLFLVLTRAGYKQPLIQSAGRTSLKRMANAFEYPNTTTLINEYMDYFVFYIERSLKNNDVKGDAFDVMEVVIKYGNKDTFRNLVTVIEEVLVQSCDKFKQKRIDCYLRIFRIFLKSVKRWFNIQVSVPIFKTKAQKKDEELQNFKVTGLDNIEEITNFSDDVMGKSAEELYKEDLERKRSEVENDHLEPEVSEYKKAEPPYHIKLTVEILKRSLNFLPSKEKDRKLLVLEILNDGVEIIKDFEDELLPVVHLIWSPLVARFKDMSVPVVTNYSVQLLCLLARVSKDFIRNRTAKDALPSILEVLSKLSQESYMKDKGSAYRYTQSYKLQIILLEKLAYLVTNIDLMEEHIEKTMDVVYIYLNNKQPLPLQSAAVKFFKLIIRYETVFQQKINKWLLADENSEYINNLKKTLDGSEEE